MEELDAPVGLLKPKTRGPIVYEEFSYTSSGVNYCITLNKFVDRYHCKYLKSLKCMAKALVVREEVGPEIINVYGEPHSCGRLSKFSSPVVNIKRAMQNRIEELAVEHLSWFPSAIWKVVYAEFIADSEVPLLALTVEQTEDYVHKSRSKLYANITEKVSMPPLALVADNDSRLFFLFSTTYVSQKKVKNAIGWAHPEFVRICRTG
jgi:hypothetical protein